MPALSCLIWRVVQRADAPPDKPGQQNVFLALKNLPSNIKYVGEQVEINGTPGGNTPKSASVLFFMSLWSFFVWSSSL